MKTTGTKKIITGISIAFASFLCLALLLEATLRVSAYFEDKKILSNDLGLVEETIKRDKVTLGDIIRVSGNDKIIYELIPDISSKTFLGQKISTNSHGFRDKEYSLNKGINTVRIVGLGDSVMFGQGVGDRQEFLSFLEHHLNNNFKNIKWEVINMAVPGYNIHMEVETLRRKGLKYNPDIIIISPVGNDISLPNFIRNHENYFTLKKSFFVEFVLRRLKRLKQRKDYALVSSPNIYNNPWKLNAPFESRPEKVPALYKDIVGWSAFEKGVRELSKLTKENNIIPIVFFFASDEDEVLTRMREIFMSNGFTHIIDMDDKYREYINKRGKREGGNNLVISSYDKHPSVVAHKMASEVVLSYMYKSGIINRIALSR